MLGAIITIGDELLNGQTIDTNSSYIAMKLNSMGVTIGEKICISDTEEAIISTLERLQKKYHILITTGGLGPTKDDITKKTIAKFYNVGFVRHQETFEHVSEIFKRRGRPFLEVNMQQADVPKNSTVLMNHKGTAPGMWFYENGIALCCMPGVPSEMRYLTDTYLEEKIKETFNLPSVLHEHIMTVGMGESFIADKIEDIEDNLPPHIKLAYLPDVGQVHLRLTGTGSKNETLQEELNFYKSKIIECISDIVFATEKISLAETVQQLFISNKKTLALAESCTGGYIGHLVTGISGASAYFEGSLVTYSYAQKENILGVKNETLLNYGAVSTETAREMLLGVLEKTNASVAAAVTGIAGPNGGTADKPVGTVYIAVGNKEKQEIKKHTFFTDRKMNIEATATAALNMLRLFLLENKNN